MSSGLVEIHNGHTLFYCNTFIKLSLCHFFSITISIYSNMSHREVGRREGVNMEYIIRIYKMLLNELIP